MQTADRVQNADCRMQTADSAQNADCRLQTQYKMQTGKKNCFLSQKRVNIPFYNLPIMTLLSRNYLTIFRILGNVLSLLS